MVIRLSSRSTPASAKSWRWTTPKPDERASRHLDGADPPGVAARLAEAFGWSVTQVFDTLAEVTTLGPLTLWLAQVSGI